MKVDTQKVRWTKGGYEARVLHVSKDIMEGAYRSRNGWQDTSWYLDGRNVYGGSTLDLEDEE